MMGAIFCVSLLSYTDDGKKGGWDGDKIISMKKELGLSDDRGKMNAKNNKKYDTSGGDSN
jgi:hypothetical protein